MNLTLDDVAEYLEEFHRYSGYGMCLCIFHDDHSPSLLVTDNGYKCKSCGEKGSLAKLYEKVSGRIVIREKTKYNPAQSIWYKWAEKFGSIQNTAKIAHQELLHNPSLGHYLKQRKIDSQIKNGKIGYLDGFYTFPIKDEYEEIQGLVARASPTIQTKELRYTVSPNCPVKLYVPSWRKAFTDEYLYVSFGTLDAWTLFMSGYAGLTGISGQELNARNLDRFRKPMFVIPDKKEERAAIELQSSLGWRANPLYLDFPDGCKDINDIHMNYGIEKVIELIEKSKEKYKYD